MRKFTVFCIFSIFGSAFAEEPAYISWDSLPFATAELSCLRTIEYLNPGWRFLRAEFDADVDGSLNQTRALTGDCIIANSLFEFNLRLLAVCSQGYIVTKKGSAVARCTGQGLNLTLTPAPNQKDPRPKGAEGKDGKSTYDLITTVTENGSPKAGVAVTLKVEVKEGSGEHSVTDGGVHNHATRNKDHSGSVPPSGKTGDDGTFKLTFKAPILAGTHTITATCDTCSNKTATKDVRVLVPDLVTLPADTLTPKTYILIGGDTPLGKNHPDNHYFTDAARETLKNVTKTMFELGWGVVGVNDGSLHDGGLFDIKGLWAPSHFEHRIGTEVDLSFSRPKPVGKKEFERTYAEICKKENAAFDIQTLWHKSDGLEPHFHMYLDGTGLRAGGDGRCCAQVFGPPKKDKKGNPILDKKGNPVLTKICE